jgi:hypothetical protein
MISLTTIDDYTFEIETDDTEAEAAAVADALQSFPTQAQQWNGAPMEDGAISVMLTFDSAEDATAAKERIDAEIVG